MVEQTKASPVMSGLDRNIPHTCIVFQFSKNHE